LGIAGETVWSVPSLSIPDEDGRATAEALRDSIGGPLHPIDEREYESCVAAVRAELGEERFVSTRAEGQAMALEQAVAYALAQADDRSAAPN
jgi:hypothetical protein